MNKTTLKNVLLVIQRTINSVDNRLLNHGEQVGFMCLRMGRALGYSEDELLSLCSLAMMHDIGAYKVEERLRMTEFEVDLPHEHAVYGSLFVRHFGPFQGSAANTILYHHWRYENRHKIVRDALVPSDAFLIHLADRISVLYAHFGPGLAEAIEKRIPRLAGTSFDPDHVEMLLQLAKQSDMIDKVVDGSYLVEIYDYLDHAPLTQEQAISYLSMLVYAIEFRSRSTVTHSVSVECGTRQIARLRGLPDSDQDTLQSAALLHDVGKITTPIDILTKPARLSDEEMATMRRHVVATSEIITGVGLDEVKDVASNHHEKLNGKGYPRGLGEDELDTGSRIVAVADILTALVEPRYYKPSLPKDRVLEVLGKAAAARDIDAGVCAVVKDNYESIIIEMERQQELTLSRYDDIASEYDCLRREVYSVLGMPAIAETRELMAA